MFQSLQVHLTLPDLRKYHHWFHRTHEELEAQGIKLLPVIWISASLLPGGWFLSPAPAFLRSSQSWSFIWTLQVGSHWQPSSLYYRFRLSRIRRQKHPALIQVHSSMDSQWVTVYFVVFTPIWEKFMENQKSERPIWLYKIDIGNIFHLSLFIK